MAIKQKQRKYKPRKSNEPCYFCVNETEPDYKQVKILDNYMSKKGRLVGRMTTGICQKHQKRIATEVKRARHLGLMPFVMRVK